MQKLYKKKLLKSQVLLPINTHTHIHVRHHSHFTCLRSFPQIVLCFSLEWSILYIATTEIQKSCHALNYVWIWYASFNSNVRIITITIIIVIITVVVVIIIVHIVNSVFQAFTRSCRDYMQIYNILTLIWKHEQNTNNKCIEMKMYFVVAAVAWELKNRVVTVWNEWKELCTWCALQFCR